MSEGDYILDIHSVYHESVVRKKKKSTVTIFACFFFKMEGIYSSFFAFDMLKRIRTIGSYDEGAHERWGIISI